MVATAGLGTFILTRDGCTKRWKILHKPPLQFQIPCGPVICSSYQVFPDWFQIQIILKHGLLNKYPGHSKALMGYHTSILKTYTVGKQKMLLPHHSGLGSYQSILLEPWSWPSHAKCQGRSYIMGIHSVNSIVDKLQSNISSTKGTDFTLPLCLCLSSMGVTIAY